MALSRLPHDLLIAILDQLPASRNEDGGGQLARVSQTSAAFREASLVATLWKRQYCVRYRHARPDKESERNAAFGGDWRLMYFERRRMDAVALRLLRKIVMKRPGRYEHTAAVFRLGFDIWDALDIESKGNVLPLVDQNVVHRPDQSSPPLFTRTFWAKSLMKSIARGYAFRLWGRVASPTGTGVAFVEAYSALSCFFGVSPKDVSNRHLQGIANNQLSDLDSV